MVTNCEIAWSKLSCRSSKRRDSGSRPLPGQLGTPLFASIAVHTGEPTRPVNDIESMVTERALALFRFARFAGS